MIKAGVSTACLYPDILEDLLLDMLKTGIKHFEIFFNTDSELRSDYVNKLKGMLNAYGADCRSLHPYTCPMESMMFFSAYERRVQDGIDYYKRYFEVMNKLGASVFVFHGNKNILPIEPNFYADRFYRLIKAGKEFGVTVAQENVSRCTSGSFAFNRMVYEQIGEDMKFVLDVKQAVRAEENPFDAIKFFGKNIVHIHMSDHGKLGDCLRIGRGSFDITKFLLEAQNAGFNGSVMLELYRNNFEDVNSLFEDYRKLCKISDYINGGK